MLLALLLAGGVAACREKPRPPAGPRLVVLYAPCTVNRQHLAPYAPDVDYTPHLARFAAQGRVFERHQTEEGMSGPAFAALLTGTQADRHGIFSHPARLADSNQLLTEAFAAAGWETWFFGDHPIAAADLGYAQGVPSHRIKTELLRGDGAGLAHVLERLRQDPQRRALIVAAFTVSHGRLPDRPLARLLRAPRRTLPAPGRRRDRTSRAGSTRSSARCSSVASTRPSARWV